VSRGRSNPVGGGGVHVESYLPVSGTVLPDVDEHLAVADRHRDVAFGGGVFESTVTQNQEGSQRL
jgi:hypothetical protein